MYNFINFSCGNKSNSLTYSLPENMILRVRWLFLYRKLRGVSLPLWWKSGLCSCALLQGISW